MEEPESFNGVFFFFQRKFIFFYILALIVLGYVLIHFGMEFSFWSVLRLFLPYYIKKYQYPDKLNGGNKL